MESEKKGREREGGKQRRKYGKKWRKRKRDKGEIV